MEFWTGDRISNLILSKRERKSKQIHQRTLAKQVEIPGLLDMAGCLQLPVHFMNTLTTKDSLKEK